MTSTVTISIAGTPTPIVLFDGNTLEAAEQAAAAAASAAAAQALVGPVYADTTAGLAATASGGFFAVNNSGVVTIYQDVAGTAVAQRTLPTTATLAATGGAALIGKSGGGTVQDAIDIALLADANGDFNITDGNINHTIVDAPLASLTLGAGSAGNPNGTYLYRITYVTADGETDASRNSNQITVTNTRVSISGIPVSGDPAVTARKIYRNAAADPIEMSKLVATIADNTTTTYTDNVADGSLGARVPFFNTTGGGISINGDPYSAPGFSTRYGINSQVANSNYACTSFGANTMPLATALLRSEAFGVDALENIVSGEGVTGVGTHAGGALTSGTNIVAIGYGALETATGGSGTVAIGAKCLSVAQSTAAVNTTAVGAQAGQSVTTGDSNCLFGYYAGQGITTGDGNCIFGTAAGDSIGVGNFNVIIGHLAGQNIAGADGNVGIGLLALTNLTTGADNVAIGGNAGQKATTAISSTFIGHNCGTNASQKVDAFTSTAIGYNAYTTKDNQVVIGGSNVEETLFPAGYVKQKVFTVAGLPSAATAGAGARAFVSDANATTFAATVAGGGANNIPVYSDGTNWKIG
jgi:hypothetical protein